jgi:hypothetical protein
MRYLAILFSCITTTLFAQSIGGFGFGVFNSSTNLPTTLSATNKSVSRIAYIKDTDKFYKWTVTNTTTNTGSWSEYSVIDKSSGNFAPSYTPVFGDSYIAINNIGNIYTWNGTSWSQIGANGTVYTEGFGINMLTSTIEVDTNELVTTHDLLSYDEDLLNASANGLLATNTGSQNATALNLLLPTRKYIHIPLGITVDYNLVNLTVVGNRGTHIYDENYGGTIGNGGIFKISDNGSTPTFLMGGLRSTDEFNFYLQPGLKYGGTVRSKMDLFARPFINPLTGVNTTDYGTAGFLIQEPVNTISNNLAAGSRYTTTNPDGTIYPLSAKGDRYTGVWSLDINTKVNGASPEFGYTPGIRFTTQDGAFAPLGIYQYKYDGMPQLRQTGAVWRTGLQINIGEYILYCDGANQNVYQATAAGTTGVTPPTHTTGTVSDGGVSWLFIHDTYSGANQAGIVVFNGSLQPGSYNIDTSYFKLPTNTNSIGAYMNGNNLAFSPQTDNVGMYWFRNGAGYKNTYGQPDWTTGALSRIYHKRNSGDIYMHNSHDGGDHQLRFTSTFAQHISGSTLIATKTLTTNTAIPDVTNCDILRLNYNTPISITNFTGTANQDLYITSLNANVTLVNNTNISLAGGLNFQLIPNMVYHFVANSSNVWCEVSNTKATGGSDTNFATTDLTMTANRTHALGNFDLKFLGGKNVEYGAKFFQVTADSGFVIKKNTAFFPQLIFQNNTAKIALRQNPTQVVSDMMITLPDSLPNNNSQMIMGSDGVVDFQILGVEKMKVVGQVSSDSTFAADITDNILNYYFTPDATKTLTFSMISTSIYSAGQEYVHAYYGSKFTLKNLGSGNIVFNPFGTETVTASATPTLTYTIGPGSSATFQMGSGTYYLNQN